MHASWRLQDSFPYFHQMQKDQKPFLFGRRPVLQLLEEGKTVDRILLQRGIDPLFAAEIKQLAGAMDIPVFQVPQQKLSRVTRKNHQGIIAFTSWVEYRNFEEVVQSAYENGRVPLVLLLDQITDVRNVGAIARSAEVFGATAMIVPARRSAAMTADTVKTSAGAILRLPVCRVRSLGNTCRKLQDMGLSVCVADQDARDSLQNANFTAPAAIVLGSEHRGVHPSLISLANSTFAIPQTGRTESLNVSVAAGIILYEVVRQRSSL